MYIGLPALDAQVYLQRENWLGVALTALMKVPSESRAEFKAQALNRLVKSPVNEYQKHLLVDCVKAYLSLSGADEQSEFERLLNTEDYREVRTMELTWYQEGLEEGVELGQRRLATTLLERRFGALPPEIQQRIEEWPESRLVELVEQSFQVTTLDELRLDDSSQTERS